MYSRILRPLFRAKRRLKIYYEDWNYQRRKVPPDFVALTPKQCRQIQEKFTGVHISVQKAYSNLQR